MKLKRFMNEWNYYYFEDPPTHASGITLNTNSISLTAVGQTYQLTATITPSDAVDKWVIWTSSDNSIAMVSRTWLVTCVTPGTCTITCTTIDWWLTATCSVAKLIYISYLLVWWWGAGWYGSTSSSYWQKPWGWGWAWWVVLCENQSVAWWDYCIVVWAWWQTFANSTICNWWDTTWFWVTAYWWWTWWQRCGAWWNWWSWWWAWWCWAYWCGCSWQWHNWWTYMWYWCMDWAGGWWWYCWAWWNAYDSWARTSKGCEVYQAWDWWQWVDITIWNWAMIFSWAGWWWGWWAYYSCDRSWANSCGWCYWSWWHWAPWSNAYWDNWIQWVAYIWYPQWWAQGTWWTITCWCWYVIHEFTTDWTFSID